MRNLSKWVLRKAGAVHLPSAEIRGIRIFVGGRSSGVEHNLAKVGVEGSNPFARSSRHLAEPGYRPRRPPEPPENKAFSGDLEGAQAECSGVFSPVPRILSKA